MNITERDYEAALKKFSAILSVRHILIEEAPHTEDFNRIMFTKKEWACVRHLREKSASSLKWNRYVSFPAELFGIPSPAIEDKLPRTPQREIDFVALNIEGRTPALLSPPQSRFPTTADCNTLVKQVHDDNMAYNRVKNWALSEHRLATENLLCYYLIELVFRTATTWKQIHKWWPELIDFMRGYDDMRPFGSFLKHIDGKAAHHPPQSVFDAVGRYGTFVMPKLLQAKMLLRASPRDALQQRKPRSYYVLYQGCVYTMTGQALLAGFFRTQN